jgi:P27 family predicted phage terminase small subunit
MTRGRKPKPPSLHLVNGNPSHLTKAELNSRLEQLNNGPDFEVPEPPDFLKKDALEEWNRLAPRLAEHGLMTALDRASFTVYCQAWGRYAAKERAMSNCEGGDVVTTPSGFEQMSTHLQISNKALEQFTKVGEKFGLSPESRASILRNNNQGASKDDGESAEQIAAKNKVNRHFN